MIAGLTRIEASLIALIALFTVAAGAVHYGSGSSVTSFLLATVGLAGIAWVVSFATEQLGERFGPAATGLMQSTLGNLPEFFVVLFALQAGQVIVATTSIVGSIFANALLVLGLSILVGARRSGDGIMRFAARLPNDTATLLMLAVFIIVAIAVSAATGDNASDNALEISVGGAICLLVVYATWVWSYVRGGAEADPAHHGVPRVALGMSIAILAVAGVAAAFVSEWFVAGLEPMIEKTGMSEAFAGLVVVAIAGNAIENATGVILAAKGQADLAVSVVKNSVAQIAVFLFPLLVLVSLFLDTQLTFSMAAVWVASLALTALIVWQVTGDGQAAAWEGVALIAFYIILATIAWYE